MQKDIKSEDEPEGLSHTLGHSSLIHQSLKNTVLSTSFFQRIKGARWHLGLGV